MGAAGLLAGRVAMVTGGARGLGAEIARVFAAAGASGAIVDLETGDPPEGWLSLRGDVTDEAAVERAVAETATSFGRLDVVVANAGVVPPWSPTEELDLDVLDRTLAVNVRGVAATLKHAAAALKEGGGAIVVMASLNAHRAHPQQHAYTASKHAVLGLTRGAALDLGRYGIRVNALAPGPVLTDALRARLERRAAEGGLHVDDAIRELGQTALGRTATAEEVAGAALFLASDLSSAVTGTLLRVDAGIA